MSGHASAASEYLAAPEYLDSDNEWTSLHDAEPDAEILSESEREPFPEILSAGKRKPRLKKILTESEIESAESDDGQQRLPGPSLYGKKPRRWISEEEWLNNIKGDPHVRLGQQRLPGPSLYGKKPSLYGKKPLRWISGEEWLNNMKLSHVAIFKIPKFLKDTKTEAYVPQSVSLGPYHHGSAELTAMDHYKGRALRKMMTRINIQMTLDVDHVAFAANARNAILKKEEEIRDSYEESIDCDGNTLAMMLVLDGCLILEVLRTLAERGFQPDMINDPIFGAIEVSASNVLKDILMLENQVPWIVLLELLQLENPKDNYVKTTLLNVMVMVTCGLFKISSEDRAALLKLDWLKSANPETHHLLGFLHNVIVHRPSNQANPGNQGEHRISIKRCIGRWLQMLPSKNKALNDDFGSIPPALELKNTGIKFRPYNGGIAQIYFDPDSSTIYLPLLSITYDTEVLLRNLIAFEMCKSSEIKYVSSYVNLMDDLIDSQKDVAFLRSMGILTNLLGSDQEVADLFNGLLKGVTARMPKMYDELRKNVNANYKNRIANYKIRIRVKFALALAVAFAVLCLTIIQSIHTVNK